VDLGRRRIELAEDERQAFPCHSLDARGAPPAAEDEATPKSGDFLMRKKGNSGGNFAFKKGVFAQKAA
jgi:hypothetical protein